MTYRAPISDMPFCMKELANLEAVAQLPGFEEAGLETAQAVLEECAKFNEGVVAPLNWEGDAAFLKAKVATAHFYTDHLISKAPGARDAIVEGADIVTALAIESF